MNSLHPALMCLPLSVVTTTPTPQPTGHLSVRSALILFIAALCGLGAGLLVVLARQPWPVGVLAGAGALAGSHAFFDRLIGS